MKEFTLYIQVAGGPHRVAQVYAFQLKRLIQKTQNYTTTWLAQLSILPIYLHFKSTFTIFLSYFVSLNFILYILFFHCSILTLWASLVKGCLFLSVFSISVFVFAPLLRACLSHYHSLSSLCLSEVCLKQRVEKMKIL